MNKIIPFVAFLAFALGFVVFAWVPGADAREIQMQVAYGSAVILIAYSLKSSGLPRVESKLQTTLFLWLFFQHVLVPKYRLDFLGKFSTYNFWYWKALIITLVFWLAYLSIAAKRYDEEDVKFLIRAIAVIGCVQVVYGIVQKIGLDKFGVPILINSEAHMRTASMVGTPGHPILFGCFLAMCIPAMLYFRLWVWATLAAVLIYLTNTDMSIVSLAAILIFYFAPRHKWVLPTVLFLAFCVLTFQTNYPLKTYNFFVDHSSARFEQWGVMLANLTEPGYLAVRGSHLATGFGFGGFPILFTMLQKNTFIHAHCDLLEFFYETGLVGFTLAVGVLGEFLWKVRGAFSMKEGACLGSIVIGILVASFGMYVLYLGIFVLWFVVLAGVIKSYSKEVNRAVHR